MAVKRKYGELPGSDGEESGAIHDQHSGDINPPTSGHDNSTSSISTQAPIYHTHPFQPAPAPAPSGNSHASSIHHASSGIPQSTPSTTTAGPSQGPARQQPSSSIQASSNRRVARRGGLRWADYPARDVHLPLGTADIEIFQRYPNHITRDVISRMMGRNYRARAMSFLMPEDTRRGVVQHWGWIQKHMQAIQREGNDDEAGHASDEDAGGEDDEAARETGEEGRDIVSPESQRIAYHREPLLPRGVGAHVNVPREGYVEEGVTARVMSHLSFAAPSDQRTQADATAFLSQEIERQGLDANVDKVQFLDNLILLENTRLWDMTRRLYLVVHHEGNPYLPHEPDSPAVVDWLDYQCSLRLHRIAFALEIKYDVSDEQPPENPSKTAHALVYQQLIIGNIYRQILQATTSNDQYGIPLDISPDRRLEYMVRVKQLEILKLLTHALSTMLENRDLQAQANPVEGQRQSTAAEEHAQGDTMADNQQHESAEALPASPDVPSPTAQEAAAVHRFLGLEDEPSASTEPTHYTF